MENLKVSNFKMEENVKFIDMCHFQVYEAKFKDLRKENNCDAFIYACISNVESELINSEVRIYAYPYEKLYYAEEYELTNLYSDRELCEALKREILNSIKCK